MKSLIAFTRLLMLQPIHRCPGCLYLHRPAAHNEHSFDMWSSVQPAYLQPQRKQNRSKPHPPAVNSS